MKNKFLILLLSIVFVTFSCTTDDRNTTFDPTNLEDTISNFQNGNLLVINPAANTDNLVTIGVSTVSNTDRSFTISLDPESTLDPSFYSIPSLSGVIPAGEFEGSIIVTTFATSVFPPNSATLDFTLESLEGASLDEESLPNDSVSFTVECPDVDISLLAGTYDVVALSFAGSFPGESDLPRTVELGPNDNQITIVEGAYPNFGGEELILTIDTDTGDIIGVESRVMTTSFGGNNYAFRSGGRVLTCAGIINVNLDFDGPVAGNPVVFNLVAQ